MATKKIYFFECLAAEGWLQHVEGISTLLMWGLIYIVLLTPLSFAISTPTGGQVEYHDFFLINNDLLAGITDYVSRHSYTPIFHPGVFSPLMLYEYFRSHIGEKRLADPSITLTNLRFGAQTALFFSAVFYLTWDCLGARNYLI